MDINFSLTKERVEQLTMDEWAALEDLNEGTLRWREMRSILCKFLTDAAGNFIAVRVADGLQQQAAALRAENKSEEAEQLETEAKARGGELDISPARRVIGGYKLAEMEQMAKIFGAKFNEFTVPKANGDGSS